MKNNLFKTKTITFILATLFIFSFATGCIKKTNYTLSLNFMGGEEVSYEKSYKEDSKVTLPTPVKADFVFVGWYKSTNYLETELVKDGFTISENTELFAKYAQNVFTIQYELYDGWFADDVILITKTEKRTITLPTPIKAGYKFLGWFKEDTFKTQVATEVEITANISFYAKWVRRATLSEINYHLDGGVLPDNADLEYSEGFEFTLAIPTKNGYTFEGWYLDEHFTSDIVTTISNRETGEKTFFAKWTPLSETYDISYVLDGGTLLEDAPKQYVKGYSQSLVEATKPGYYFIGWYKDDSFTTQISEISSTSVGAITLYAKFEIITYSISYRLNDGTPLNNLPTNFTILDKTILPSLQLDGYYFVGWYDLQGNKYTEILEGTTHDIHLYAKFVVQGTDETYEVRYFDLSKNLIKTVTIKRGNLASYLTIDTSIPECSWYQEDECLPYDFSTPVYRNCDLYLKWTVCGDVLSSIFGNGDLYDNVTIKSNYSINGDDLKLSLTVVNPDSTTFNPITGSINPKYTDTPFDLIATMTYLGITSSFNVHIVVKKVQFKELSNTLPVIGYVYTGTGINLSEEAYATLDIINLCFVRVTGTYIIDTTEIESSVNSVLDARKRGIRVLFSIGGYGSAGINIAAAAKTDTTRKKLAQSILDTIEKFHFDGVDMDWEYPGFETGNPLDVDKPNYTLLMTEIYNTLKNANKDYIVSAALPGGGSSNRYEVAKVNEVLDYMNIMTYDLNSSSNATFHCALYSNYDYTPYGSSDTSMQEYVKAGASPKKLIIGAAFYGKKFITTGPGSSKTGIGATVSQSSSVTTVRYSQIVETYLSNPKIYTRYYDSVAQCPYIYGINNVVITYDDPQSIKAKCDYVKTKGFGGIMFWDYGSDTTGELIHALNEAMK